MSKRKDGRRTASERASTDPNGKGWLIKMGLPGLPIEEFETRRLRDSRIGLGTPGGNRWMNAVSGARKARRIVAGSRES